MAVSQYFHRVSYRTARSRIEPNRSIWDRTKPNRSPPTSLPPPTSHLPPPSCERHCATQCSDQPDHPPPPTSASKQVGSGWWEEVEVEVGGGGGRRWEEVGGSARWGRGVGGGWQYRTDRHVPEGNRIQRQPFPNRTVTALVNN